MAALSIIKGAVKYGPKIVKKIKKGLKRRKEKKELLEYKGKTTPKSRKLAKTLNPDKEKNIKSIKDASEMADKYYKSKPGMPGVNKYVKKSILQKKSGGKIMEYSSGGRVKIDGCATRGKTRGRMV